MWYSSTFEHINLLLLYAGHPNCPWTNEHINLLCKSLLGILIVPEHWTIKCDILEWNTNWHISMVFPYWPWHQWSVICSWFGSVFQRQVRVRCKSFWSLWMWEGGYVESTRVFLFNLSSVQKYLSIYQLSLPIANIEYRISSLYAFSVLSPDLHFLHRTAGMLQQFSIIFCC